MINEVLQWAEKEKPVRAVILVGSRAQNKHDALSDYDLQLFCDNIDALTRNDAWLSKIGKIWVCVHEKVRHHGKDFPSRLVIFDKGVKIDFAFYPVEALKEIASAPSLVAEYNRGYKVLLDKDQLTTTMPAPNPKFRHEVKPNQQEFLTVVNEFWFEAYHVAVYLKRGDLWSAHFRLSGLHHQFLLKMIEWNELSKIDWKDSLPAFGKRMQLWVSPKTRDALHRSFAHFDEEVSWNALKNIMALFRHLSCETAQLIGYSYPRDVDDNISDFINQLGSRS